MPVATATLTITLYSPSGVARQGVDVTYRVGPRTVDDDADSVNEGAIYSRPITLQTNSSGVASFVVPASSVVYVSIPAAGISEARITSPGSGTREIAQDLALPTPV